MVDGAAQNYHLDIVIVLLPFLQFLDIIISNTYHSYTASLNSMSNYKYISQLLFSIDRNIDKILVGKPEGRKQLRRLRCKWENNTRIDLREIGWKDVDWMHLAEDRDQ